MKYGTAAPWPGWKYGAHKYRAAKYERGRAAMSIVGKKGFDTWTWNVGLWSHDTSRIVVEVGGEAESADAAVAAAEAIRDVVEQSFAALKRSA